MDPKTVEGSVHVGTHDGVCRCPMCRIRLFQLVVDRVYHKWVVDRIRAEKTKRPGASDQELNQLGNRLMNGWASNFRKN